mgnify:CR=1 FL=1|jgi:hypothetical protein
MRWTYGIGVRRDAALPVGCHPVVRTEDGVDGPDTAGRGGLRVCKGEGLSRQALPITHQVNLMTDQQVVALVRRWEDILAGCILPRRARSKKSYAMCAFPARCNDKIGTGLAAGGQADDRDC